MQEGPVYGVVLIVKNANVKLSSETLSQYPTVLTISGYSDTLTQTLTENTNKMTVVLGLFSIIVLVPIFETLFGKNNTPSPQLPTPSMQRQQ